MVPAQPGRQHEGMDKDRASTLSMRVGDADRAEVADLLARHYSDGRLDRAEFDQRLDQAMRARTRADLLAVVTDLPDPAIRALPVPAVQPAPPPASRRRPRGRRTTGPLPGIILIVVLVLLLGHVVRTATWILIVTLSCLWLLLWRNRRH